MDFGTTPVEWWISCHDAQAGDQMREGPYHITLSMHVMLILFMHLILLRFDRCGSIIRWSLPLNIKIIMCSSIVCTVKKVRRFEAPRDDRFWFDGLYVRIRRVQDRFSHANATVLLGEPNMYIHGLGTCNRKVNHEAYGWYDEHVDVHH